MNKYEIKQQIKDIADWLVNVSTDLCSDKLLKKIAIVFKERVKKKLKACDSYLQSDIQQYVDAIHYKKVSNDVYRIWAGSKDDPQLTEDMYYLEYGTGIEGAKSPHDMHDEIGWNYNLNEHPENIGWFFRRGTDYGNEDTFIAENDKVYHYKRSNKANGKNKGDERVIRSYGVKPMRYFYDTIREFDKIVLEAYERINKK